jgi:hypothetical protein
MELTDESAIHYSFGIGPIPAFYFGRLTLDDWELMFKPDALPWVPRGRRVPVRTIVRAEVRSGASPFRRRLVWILGALFIPWPGILGLFWLPKFWHRAGSGTLEVYTKLWRFLYRRVYIVNSPEQWAESINGLIGSARSDPN